MSFEKEYYEHEGFWDGDMLVDKKNSIRFQETINLVPKDINSLVDIGCGNGIFLNKLKQFGNIKTLLGIDRSSNALKYLQTETLLSDINETQLPDNAYDCVTSLQVIEHLPIPQYNTALKELTRISKKYVIIGVPYEEEREKAYTKCPSCLTIFNRDLHLRSYNLNDFKNLLNDYGYKNIKTRLEGESKIFYGHNLFISIFYPSQKKITFESPICPICGYKKDMKKSVSKSHLSNNPKSFFSTLKSIPKKIWPTKTKHYWIMGVFQKMNE